MKKIVYGSSIKGNGHYISGTECQDSNSFCEEDLNPNEEIKVICLSDGHGGAPYFRSAIGSKYAVSIAKKAMYDFIKNNIDTLDLIDSSKEKRKTYSDAFAEAKEKLKQYKDKLAMYRALCEFQRKAKINMMSSDFEEEIQKAHLTDEQIEILSSKTSEEIINETNTIVKEYNDYIQYYNKSLKLKNNNPNGECADETDRLHSIVDSINNDLKEVKKDIVSKWNEEVDNHLLRNPVDISIIEMYKIETFNDSARRIGVSGYSEKLDNAIKMINKNLDEKSIQGVINNPRQLYGATLLCVGTYKEHNFIIQIGDGDITLVDKNDEVTFPVVKPDNQIGNETNSICQRNALKRFSELYFQKELKMIMISTDGIVNALERESDLGMVATNIYESISEEPSTFRGDYKPYLLRPFSNGSGDDCTICFIANNIEDKVFDVFVSSIDVPDNNDLDKTYIDKFKKYHINKELYQLNENEESSKQSFAKLGVNAVQEGYKSIKDELATLIDAKQELNSISLKNSILKVFQISNNKKLDQQIDDNLNKFRKVYNDYLEKKINENPIIVMKQDKIVLSLTEAKEVSVTNNTTKYALVKEMKDNVICYDSITEEDYKNISTNLKRFAQYRGKIKVGDDSFIVIEDNKISLIN